MCGICGYAELGSRRPISEEILKSMCSTLSRRGPDEEEVFVDRNIGLGQRRLSIIDLVTGKQPVFNEDKTAVVISNGEIYNFRELRKTLSERQHGFYTNSDTETIVHAYEEWGIDCLRHLNGMFAFAIWDRKKNLLFLARDRMGEKPLYYTQINNQFVFGSELKALVKHPFVGKELDFDALSLYLAFEYIPSPGTIFKAIYKLPPGHYLKIDLNIPSVSAPVCYWDSSFKAERNLDLSIKDYCTELVRLFKESVRKRLVSDVPLGVFLSGGIDSSIIVAMMSELMPAKNIKTFNVSFAEKSFDESRYAINVAKIFGTDHHEERLDSQAMLKIIPEVAAYMDEPFADASIIPAYLLSKFCRKHITVALSGDGGDELFCGYPTFLAHKVGGLLEKLPQTIKLRLCNLAMKLPVSTANFSFDFKTKLFFSGLLFNRYIRQQVWLGSFDCAEQRKLFNKNIALDFSEKKVYEPVYRYWHSINTDNELDKVMYLYYKLYLVEDILLKSDRASMANSLEVRAPFLDKEVVEFVNQIPNNLKLKGVTSKYILKKAFSKKLPQKIINRPKKGFGVPIAEWFKNDLRPLLTDIFEREKIKKEGIFDAAYIQGLLREHFSGRRDHRKQLWTLLAFELWHENWHND